MCSEENYSELKQFTDNFHCISFNFKDITIDAKEMQENIAKFTALFTEFNTNEIENNCAQFEDTKDELP